MRRHAAGNRVHGTGRFGEVSSRQVGGTELLPEDENGQRHRARHELVWRFNVSAARLLREFSLRLHNTKPVFIHRDLKVSEF